MQLVLGLKRNTILYFLNVISVFGRYEQKWLPLAAENLDKVLVAPLDIEWIWYVHMMNPVAYEEDCKTHAGGKVINHKVYSREERAQLIQVTKELWNRSYPGEVFYADLKDPNPPIDQSFKSSLGYDLEKAVAKEMIFNYQIALPHFRDENFLREAVKRYWFMLMAYKESSEVPVVPYSDNDLVWHSHMAHPKIYKNETIELFYYILPHTFNDSVRLPGTEAWAKVTIAKKVWEEKKKPIAVPGGMFRGKPPAPVPARNPDRYKAYSHKTYYLQPKELRINDFEEGSYRVVVKCESREPEVTKTFIVYDSGFCKLQDIFSKKFDYDADESRFILSTDRFYGLSISLYKELSETLFESYVATCDFPPKPLVGKKISEFMLSITLKFAGHIDKTGKSPLPSKELRQFTGTFSLRCPIIKAGDYSLQVQKKESAFRSYQSLSELLHLPGVVIPFHVDKRDIACHYADHFVVGSLGEPAFHLRVVHCLLPKVSVVEIADFNSEMVASAHVVDNGTLPSPMQVLEPKSCVTLNPQIHRAMVVRGESCDWGILRASWQGYRKFFNPGHLAVEFFMLGLNPQQWIPVHCSGPNKTIFTIDLRNYEEIACQLTVDVSSATVRFLGTASYVPELFCLSACIAVLFTLCQTREPPPTDNEGKMLPYSTLSKKSFRLDVDKLDYVVSAGLYCPSLPCKYEV